MKFLQTFALAGTLALPCLCPASAVVTIPGGSIKIPIKAGSFTSPSTQWIAIGLSKPPAFQAAISSVSTVETPAGSKTQLNFAANSFPGGTFNGPGGTATFGVEIVGGPADGQISEIKSTVDNAVVLSHLIPSVSGATSARFRRLWTVQEAFGSQNSAGFLGGPDAGVADIIRIIRASDPPLEIFFNTGTSRWETVTGEQANALPIPADAGLEVVRRGMNDIAVTVVGEVKTGPTAIRIGGGPGDVLALRQNPYPIPAMRLKDLGLYTGDPQTGLKAGTSESTADVVTIQDPATGARNQFFMDSATGRWKTGFSDASLIQIPANASISLTRRSGEAFTWLFPQPVMALQETPLPLTLAGVASRKTHASGGTWDVNLPLTGATGIESRTDGTRNFTLVFTFEGASTDNPLATGNAAINTGSVSGVNFAGNEMRVELSGVTNAQSATVSLSGVTARNGQAFGAIQATFGTLQGDINANRSVTSADTTVVRRTQGTSVSLGNFRADINLNGSVTSADQTLCTRSQGTFLP